MITAHIALGSNVGDREAHLEEALRGLRAVPGVEVTRVSTWIETEFVGDGPAQGAFLNGAAELRTTLSPAALLEVMGALERAAGRASPHPRNHPRQLDLDLIFFGAERIDTKGLQVPHPRWHEREFVCAPLRELGVDLEACPRVSKPQVITAADELSRRVSDWLAGGCVVGLVPTMGSLHAGHASLMRAARMECDRVLATVFVNPLQFGPGEDFVAYPRDLERDLAVCADAGVDALFAPASSEMFGEGCVSHVGTGPEALGMEGAARAGHFSGVATVVARLFAMARPHRAYFGEKDAQQLAVVRRMSADLGFPVEVVACPIIREEDGLAMSSRNVYLSKEDRRAAGALYRALQAAQQLFCSGDRDRDRLVAAARAVLDDQPRCKVDYVELRREGGLGEMPPGDVDGGRMLVAARFDGGDRPVRLLDNLGLSGGGDL